jgi:hypothetical protein
VVSHDLLNLTEGLGTDAADVLFTPDDGSRRSEPPVEG